MKTTIRGAFNFLFLAAAILAVIILAWIGAEYTFEDAVSFGIVDAGFACIVTHFVMKDIRRFIKKKGIRADGADLVVPASYGNIPGCHKYM